MSNISVVPDELAICILVECMDGAEIQRVSFLDFTQRRLLPLKLPLRCQAAFSLFQHAHVQAYSPQSRCGKLPGLQGLKWHPNQRSQRSTVSSSLRSRRIRNVNMNHYSLTWTLTRRQPSLPYSNPTSPGQRPMGDVKLNLRNLPQKPGSNLHGQVQRHTCKTKPTTRSYGLVDDRSGTLVPGYICTFCNLIMRPSH